MKIFRSPNSGVWIALGIALLSLIGVTFDLWSGNRTVPYILRFVPPNAQAYVVTGPLKDLWLHGPAHLPLNPANSDDKISSAFQDFQKNVASHCLLASTPADLHRNGIDGSRGALFALLDRTAPNYVVAIPISQRELALQFLIQLVTNPKTLELSTGDGDAAPRKIHIEANTSNGVKLCVENNPAPVTIRPGMSFDLDQSSAQKSVKFFVIDDGTRTDPKIDIKCSTELDDGSRVPCTCQIDGIGCSDSPLQVGVVKQDLPVEDGRSIATYKLESPQILISFPDNDTALLADGADSLLSALHESSNIAFFRADDTLRVTHKRIFAPYDPGDAVIFASVNLPVLPISGNAHLSIIFNRNRVLATAVFPWQTLQSTALERIIALPRSVERYSAYSARAKVDIRDAALGYYLRYAKSYIKSADDNLRRFFGNLTAFVDQLMRMDDVGALTLSIQGLRDGVPNLVIALRTTDAIADDLIFQQRAQFRAARDMAILSAAAHELGEIPTEIDSVVSKLAPEQQSFFKNYKIAHSGEIARENLKFEAPDFKPESFRNETYDLRRGDRLYQFLAPKIGDNDVRYRGLDKAKSVDVEALREGRFRPVASYDKASQRLLIGTDLDTLTEYFGTGSDDNRAVASADPPGSKLSLSADLSWLVAQALLYPDKDTGEFARAFLVPLQRYRTFNLHLEPQPRDHVLIGTVRISHD